jgi:hypothetical protein
LDREQSNREMYGIEYRFIGGFNWQTGYFETRGELIRKGIL